MVLKLASVKIDPVKEKDGVWEDSVDIPGVKLRVRPFDNSDYQKARMTEGQKLIASGASDDLSDEELARLRGKLIAEHILLDWKGFDREYTKELAREVLCDPDFRKLCDAIESASLKASELAFEQVEEVAKN